MWEWSVAYGGGGESAGAGGVCGVGSGVARGFLGRAWAGGGGKGEAFVSVGGFDGVFEGGGCRSEERRVGKECR